MGKSSKLKQREAEIQESAFKERFILLSRRAESRPAPPPLTNEFMAYSKAFVRAPEDFVLRTRSDNRGKQVLELARHLFGRFRVPRVLEQAWEAYLEEPLGNNRPNPVIRHANSNFNLIDFRAWFVCVATGGSLYKTHTQGFLTKKETHAFLGAPPTLDLCQAVVYAVALGAGAKEGDAMRLARSKVAEKPFDEFWFNAVRFFCLPDHMPTSLPLVNDLVDYIQARRLEEVQFRLLGSAQSLQAVLRRMEQWHRALARAKDLSGLTWSGVALPDFSLEKSDPQNPRSTVTWAVHQILSGKELAAEGSAMRHCVFGYKARCLSGDCSIWSLTRTEPFGAKVRRLTIEMNRYGTLVQKRGLANRLPRPEEEQVLKQWALAHGLSIC